MEKAAPTVRDDSSYGSRIQKLVEQGRVGGARRLIEEALRERPNDPDLLSWKEILAPGRVFGRKPVNFEGTAEQRLIAKGAGPTANVLEAHGRGPRKARLVSDASLVLFNLSL
jgi:hypothetical protein